MAQTFTYLGGQEMLYQDYLDAETGKMLIAVMRDEPYSMVPVNPGSPVPPTDGRWADYQPPVVPPVPPPTPAVQPASPVTPAPQGGE